MSKGLFKSIYSKDGIYNDLYSKRGSSPPTQRTDIRLGGLGGYFGQAEAEDDDDDDDDEKPTVPGPKKAALFSEKYKGFPTWLIGLFLLGFAWSMRRKKQAAS